MSNQSQTKLLEQVNKLSGDDEMVELYTDLSRREIEYNTLLEDALEKREIEYNTLLEDALEQQDKIHEKRLKETLEEQEEINKKRLEDALEQQEKLNQEEKIEIAKKLLAKGMSEHEVKEIIELDNLNIN